MIARGLARILIGCLLLFSVCKITFGRDGNIATGTERINLAPVVNVLVFSTPAPGQWASRIAKVHGFSDGVIAVCFEWKNSVQAECLVIVNDGETIMAPVRLLEEKT